MKYYNLPQSGFSLVETLVAITILLIIIVGPMTISSSTARSTSFASEQVIAFFLAQEGVELVQKYRDELVLSSFNNNEANPWDKIVDKNNGPLANCYKDNGCRLMINNEGETAQVVECTSGSSSGSCALSYNRDATGRAKYTNVNEPADGETVYNRVINLEVVGTNSIKVISKVTWRTGNQARSQDVSVESYIYDVYGL